MSTKQVAIRGVLWDLIGLFGQQAFGLVITIFLARLLEPAEFGLVGMAMVFLNMFLVFSELGLSSALIQNKKNRSLTYSSVFYINIGAGLVLFTLFQLLAPLIGSFYETAEVSKLIRVLAFVFPISSLSVVQQTILMRDVNFKKLTLRDLFAQVLGGALGIFLALQGYGVYSLVAQVLVTLCVKTIILWRVSSWYPKLEFSAKEVSGLLPFGMYVFLSQFLNQFTRRFDVLMIGKFFDASTLGFYSRASSLNKTAGKFSSTSIKKVFFPVFSRIRDNRTRFEYAYFKLLNLISLLAFLLTGLLVFAGKEIIIGLFGPKWEPSVFIFQVLALNAISFPINSIIINSFLASGKSKENFWIGIVRKILLVGSISVAIFYGMKSLLITIVIVGYLSTFINLYSASRFNDFDFVKQIKVVSTYLLFFGLSATIVLISVQTGNEILSFGLVKAVLFLVSYLLLNLVFKSEGLIFLWSNNQYIWSSLNIGIKRS